MKKSNPFTIKPLTSDLSFYGFYRAKVVDNKDPLKYGRVKVFIPDIMFAVSQSEMETVDDKDGLWALPANNGYGGRNLIENDKTIKDQGTCYIPYVNTWVWVFFEKGNPNRPYYFGAFDSRAHKVPPECQIGDEYYNKQLLSRTKKGRVIIISDDPYDERVELTGKKRKYNPESEDNSATIFETKDNQTIILIDEREGKEKILIKDYKGNYINIKQTDDSFNIFSSGDCKVWHKKNGEITFDGDVNIRIAGDLNVQVDGNVRYDIDGRVSHNVGNRIDVLANGDINMDAPNIYLNSGKANPEPIPRDPLLPDGKRDMNKPQIKDNFNIFSLNGNKYTDDYQPLSPSELSDFKNHAKAAFNEIDNDPQVDQTVKDITNHLHTHIDEVLDAVDNNETKLKYSKLPSNKPLLSYLANDGNVVGNIMNNGNLSNRESLNTMLYNLSYYLQYTNGGLMYNVPGIDDAKHNELVNMMFNQCNSINSLFTNMFSSSYDFKKSPKLVNRFKVFNALHVVNNIWNKNYYDYLPELSEMLGFKYTNSYIKTILPSFSGNEWIQYIAEQVLNGNKTPNEIITEINNTFDTHVGAMLESSDRFNPLLASSVISDYYGPVTDYISKDQGIVSLYKLVTNLNKFANIKDKIKFSERTKHTGSFNIFM